MATPNTSTPNDSQPAGLSEFFEGLIYDIGRVATHVRAVQAVVRSCEYYETATEMLDADTLLHDAVQELGELCEQVDRQSIASKLVALKHD